MNKLKFLLIIFCVSTYGQDLSSTIEVNYTEITDFGILTETMSNLKVNNYISIYTRKKIIYNDISEDITIKKYNDTLTDKKQVLEIFYSNSLKKNIFIQDNSLKQNLLVKDSIIAIKWTMDVNSTGETILGYKCNKATGEFRGRHYTVWFTTEIPTSLGPWKFHGLPGLVLKVKDNYNQILIQATKIAKSKEEKIENIDINSFEDIVTVKDYITLTKKKENDLLNETISKVQATMPRGSIIKNINAENNNKNSYEIIYEWEKTKEEED